MGHALPEEIQMKIKEMAMALTSFAINLGFVEESVAYGIDENGVIVGYVDSGPDVFPVAWVPTGGRQ